MTDTSAHLLQNVVVISLFDMPSENECMHHVQMHHWSAHAEFIYSGFCYFCVICNKHKKQNSKTDDNYML